MVKTELPDKPVLETVSLPNRGSEAREELHVLIENIPQDPLPGEVESAARQLAESGEQAIPSLVEYLRADHPTHCIQVAVTALGYIGGQAVQALLSPGQCGRLNPNHDLSLEVSMFVASRLSGALDFEGIIERAINHRDHTRKKAAQLAIGLTKGPDDQIPERAVNHVENFRNNLSQELGLESGNPFLRVAAHATIGILSPRERRVQVLREQLQDQNLFIRGCAIETASILLLPGWDNVLKEHVDNQHELIQRALTGALQRRQPAN